LSLPGTALSFRPQLSAHLSCCRGPQGKDFFHPELNAGRFIKIENLTSLLAGASASALAATLRVDVLLLCCPNEEHVRRFLDFSYTPPLSELITLIGLTLAIGSRRCLKPDEGPRPKLRAISVSDFEFG
jgi:hypothetical protein